MTCHPTFRTKAISWSLLSAFRHWHSGSRPSTEWPFTFIVILIWTIINNFIGLRFSPPSCSGTQHKNPNTWIEQVWRAKWMVILSTGYNERMKSLKSSRAINRVFVAVWKPFFRGIKGACGCETPWNVKHFDMSRYENQSNEAIECECERKWLNQQKSYWRTSPTTHRRELIFDMIRTASSSHSPPPPTRSCLLNLWSLLLASFASLSTPNSLFAYEIFARTKASGVWNYVIGKKECAICMLKLFRKASRMRDL
jgi:hypothetical protein